MVVELTASTSVGMSGGPIISNDVLLGVYVGGPPLPGQREAYQVVELLGQNKIMESWELLKSCVRFDCHLNKEVFRSFINYSMNKEMFCILLLAEKQSPDEVLRAEYEDVKMAWEIMPPDVKSTKDALISSISNLIYEICEHTKDSTGFDFNTGISVRHPLFKEVEKIVNCIETITQTFSNITALMRWIRSSLLAN